MPTATDSPLESFFLALKNLYSTVLHYTKQFFSFHKEQTRSEADLQFELMQLYSQNQGLNVFTYKPQTRGILFDLYVIPLSITFIGINSLLLAPLFLCLLQFMTKHSLLIHIWWSSKQDLWSSIHMYILSFDWLFLDLYTARTLLLWPHVPFFWLLQPPSFYV